MRVLIRFPDFMFECRRPPPQGGRRWFFALYFDILFICLVGLFGCCRASSVWVVLLCFGGSTPPPSAHAPSP